MTRLIYHTIFLYTALFILILGLQIFFKKFRLEDDKKNNKIKSVKSIWIGGKKNKKNNCNFYCVNLQNRQKNFFYQIWQFHTSEEIKEDKNDFFLQKAKFWLEDL